MSKLEYLILCFNKLIPVYNISSYSNIDNLSVLLVPPYSRVSLHTITRRPAPITKCGMVHYYVFIHVKIYMDQPQAAFTADSVSYPLTLDYICLIVSHLLCIISFHIETTAIFRYIVIHCCLLYSILYILTAHYQSLESIAVFTCQFRAHCFKIQVQDS